MKHPKVIIIAQNHPLNNDSQLKRKMISAENRAERQSARFPGLDLAGIQKGVHQNILKAQLFLDGRYLDLLDLMNFVKNKRQVVDLTPDNVAHYYSLANSVTLNGIYLYQYLLEQGFAPVVIQNFAVANLQDFLEEAPLAVCISSNFIFMNDIKEIARQVKQYAPETSVIAGGMLVKKVLEPGEDLSPQALTFLSEFYGYVDTFVIESQGEQTLMKLLHALKSREDISKIHNLALFDRNGRMVFTQRQREEGDMDRTAISWDKIPKAYLRKTLPVNSSRGCYYRCRFCTYHWLFPRVEYKSIDTIKKELRTIQNLGFVKHIRFTDDNFTARKERLTSVLEMMIREKFNFTWSSFARASALTPELVDLMKRSGCEFVDMGLESGSQVVLDNMDKRLKREQSLDAIRMLNDNGIYGRGSFIIGYPGETRETFAETIDLINESGLPYYHAYLFYFSGNTIVYQLREEFGLQGLGLAWRHDTMDAVEASHLMSLMPGMIDKSFTDGQAYVEEIYKLLRVEGYSPEEILQLFKLKRELLLTTRESNPADGPYSPRGEQILSKLEGLVKPANE